MKKLISISTVLACAFIWNLSTNYSKDYTYTHENKQHIPDEVSYDPAFKDRIYGNTFRGLAMSIEPTQKQYQIGDEIEISVLLRNFGKEKIRSVTITGETVKNYRFCLFDPNGQTIPKSKYSEEVEISSIGRKPEVPYSVRGTYIQPGVETGATIVRFDQYFNIEKEGTYFLVMMRRITKSWEDGFLISNMTKINIVNPKEKKIEQGALKSE